MPEGAVLVVSYIGYVTREIPVGASTNLTIILKEDTQMLDEVVVVGYGVQRRETLAGAVASIGSAETTTTKTDNVVSNMQGKMPVTDTSTKPESRVILTI